MKNRGLKILIWDLEISPIISYNWRLWKSNAVDVIEDSQILCFAYKWLGEKKAYFVGQPDFKGYKPGVNDDRKVVKEIHKLFSEADVVVAHNGDRFDQKIAQSRMMVHDMLPPQPYAQIDTLKVVKKYGRFSSNSLKYLVKQLGLNEKGDAGGIETWKGCLAGDKKAWKEMKKYNLQDILILEELYLRLRPWIDNHPSQGVATGEPKVCPKCGESKMRRAGTFMTKVGKRQRYQCKSCGGWAKGRIIESASVKYIN